MTRRPSIQDRIAEVLLACPEGLTDPELREKLGLAPHEQNQLQRRRRALRSRYELATDIRDGKYYHRIVRPREKALDEEPISLRLRAEVLRLAQGRCQMCGASVEDGARLVIDHKVPRAWGGRTELENLQALCTDCNAGKKADFAAHDGTQMAAILAHDSVHVRIGELLKAANGDPVTADAMRFAAGQHDWMKRARELRYLGWEFKVSKRKEESGRVISLYSLTKAAPWPDDPTRIIREYEERRARANRRASTQERE